MNIKTTFTSNPEKYIYHPNSMKSYIENTGNSVISTHISPEGRCNLNCNYCSVKNRVNSNNIKLDVIKDYIIKLKSRGLKAVIITGGGEPTLYKEINELIEWLFINNIKIGLITNGTLCHNVTCWNLLSWVRVSINFDNDTYKQINIPYNLINNTCTLGGSHVFNKIETIEEYEKKLNIIYNEVYLKNNLTYIRLTEDCNNINKQTIINNIKTGLKNTNLIENNFFIQDKILKTPNVKTCHQSYFRPYLSEVDGGSVFPCDSLVLNNDKRKFSNEYILCKPYEILDYLDKKIKQKFCISSCINCAFSNNNEFIETQIREFNEEFYKKDITDVNQYFV